MTEGNCPTWLHYYVVPNNNIALIIITVVSPIKAQNNLKGRSSIHRDCVW